MKKLSLAIMLVLLTGLLLGETVKISSGMNSVRLISSDRNTTVLSLTINEFEKSSIRIAGEDYSVISLDKEPLSQVKGAPMLPEVNRSIVIPAFTNSEIRVLESSYKDYDMNIAPSKGPITRDINPEDVAYTFGPAYSINSFYPADITELSEPYILRDMRGIVVKFKPFIYNPVTKTLRVYTNLLVEVENSGINMENSLSRETNSYSKEFISLYENHFMNFSTQRYTPVEETGSLLAIAPTQYMDLMQEYVDWKNQKGIPSELVELSTIGTTATEIQSYIQNYYDNNPNLTFVQLAGDAPQLPALSHVYQYQTGGADPILALVNGTDSYPDLFVGRFSAETVDQLETQIDRVIWYERDIDETAEWLNNAMGIASDEGGTNGNGDMGESDIIHMNNIRTDLNDYGYQTIDQVYDPSASSSSVANNVNQGRGFINYVGHGSTTAWYTTGFSVSNCNQLTNNYKLPFIVSVACINGNFVSNTCFAEAWTRATNGDAPTGAIAFYGSSVNQDWNSPMRGQDEIVDLLIAEEKTSVGGLFYNGSCEMMDNYGSVGQSMYKTWNIFGDASLMVRTKQPSEMTVSHMPTFFLGATSFNVSVSNLDNNNQALVSISENGVMLGSGYTDNTGIAEVELDSTPSEPTTLTITVTAFNKITYTADLLVTSAQGPYIVVNDLAFTNPDDAQFGRTGILNISLENVGIDDSSELNISIASDDSNIVISQSEATSNAIATNNVTTIDNAFTVQISDSITDQYIIPITVTITDNADNSWITEKQLLVNAPSLTVESVNWTEISGNGNTLIDQGEIWNLQFIAVNNGHATTRNGYTTLTFENDMVSYIPSEIPYFTRLGIGASVIGNYNVAFSSQIATPETIGFEYGIVAGNYVYESSDSIILGLTMETFDNSFYNYEYTFSGGDWTIDSNGSHDGAAAKSPDIGNSSVTSMQVTMNVVQAGQISFWKRVSSELSYDCLKFYIDNQAQDEWSGTVNWSQNTYDVTAGNHTFKWEYSKDWMSSSGDDCVWVDDIIYPFVPASQGAPDFSIDTLNIDFGEVSVGQENSQSITISNSGDGIMIGRINSISPDFTIRKNEVNYDELSYYMESGQSFEFEIAFTPTELGNLSEQIIVFSDDPNNLETGILVYGVGRPTDNNDNVAVYSTSLKGNYPNPFNPETNISFSLKDNSNVKIEIYNILGKKINTIMNAEMTKGNHTVVWKGIDTNGKQVSSGIYFYRMTAGKYKETNKMILMK